MEGQAFGAPERRKFGTSWVNVLLGVWVIISPFVLGIESPKGIWNNVVIGVAICILAILRATMRQPGWSWVNLFLGIWLVISPFVLVLGSTVMWHNVILGIIVAAFALTNTYSKTSTAIGI